KDVEGTDIEERDLEVFGGGVVDVGEQGIRCRRLGLVEKHTEKPFDPPTAVPSHDARRDLVANREQQSRRMRRKALHVASHGGSNVPGHSSVVKKRDVLSPWQAHDHAETALRGLVEDARWRWRVRTNRVRAQLSDSAEVTPHAVRCGKQRAVVP